MGTEHIIRRLDPMFRDCSNGETTSQRSQSGQDLSDSNNLLSSPPFLHNALPLDISITESLDIKSFLEEGAQGGAEPTYAADRASRTSECKPRGLHESTTKAVRGQRARSAHSADSGSVKSTSFHGRSLPHSNSLVGNLRSEELYRRSEEQRE